MMKPETFGREPHPPGVHPRVPTQGQKPYQIVQQQAQARRKQARMIAGADVTTPLPRETDGKPKFQHRALEHSGYIARQGEPFVRRAIPKVKGKAAKKQHKRARHAARNRQP